MPIVVADVMATVFIYVRLMLLPIIVADVNTTLLPLLSSDMNKPCWKLAKACPQSQKLFCFGENNLLMLNIYSVSFQEIREHKSLRVVVDSTCCLMFPK